MANVHDHGLGDDFIIGDHLEAAGFKMKMRICVQVAGAKIRVGDVKSLLVHFFYLPADIIAALEFCAPANDSAFLGFVVEVHFRAGHL